MFNLAKVSPSIIAVDYLNQSTLQSSIKLVEKSGCKMLHLDVMDGKFVPNTTFDYNFVARLSKLTDLLIDVHLMVEEPQRCVQNYIDAGANIISVHIEACSDIRSTLKYIKDHNCLAGVAMSPKTDIREIKSLLDEKLVDIVLVMSVEPGRCGQEYIFGSAEKVAWLKAYGGSIEIEVDGGINVENAKVLRMCGADILVSGSAIFNSDNPSKMIRLLQGNIIKNRILSKFSTKNKKTH